MSHTRVEDERVARRFAEHVTPKVHVKEKRKRCAQCGIVYPIDEVFQEHDENGTPSGWFCLSCV